MVRSVRLLAIWECNTRHRAYYRLGRNWFRAKALFSEIWQNKKKSRMAVYYTQTKIISFTIKLNLGCENSHFTKSVAPNMCKQQFHRN